MILNGQWEKHGVEIPETIDRIGSPLAPQFYDNESIRLEEKLLFGDTRITCKIKLKTVLSKGFV